jgi:hypothetical protein
VRDRRTAAQTQVHEDVPWRDLRLEPLPLPIPPLPLPELRAADRIKAALLRWLEEDM